MRKIFKTAMIATSIMVISASPAMAGRWTASDADANKGYNKWRYIKDDGNLAKNEWQKINNTWYYFGPDGYKLTNTITPDGYWVNASGMWVENYTTQVTSSASVSTTTNQSNASTQVNSSEELTSKSAEELAYEMVELINKDRTKYGREELEIDDTLMEFAAVRAEEISEKFSHTRPDGTKCTNELKNSYDNYSSYGENINKATNESPESAETALMNSAGHRKNILNTKYIAVGVGVYKLNNVYHYVQIFGGGSNTPSESEANISSMSDEEFQAWAKEASGDTDEFVEKNNVKYHREGDPEYGSFMAD